jgi:hypothetical protein
LKKNSNYLFANFIVDRFEDSFSHGLANLFRLVRALLVLDDLLDAIGANLLRHVPTILTRNLNADAVEDGVASRLGPGATFRRGARLLFDQPTIGPSHLLADGSRVRLAVFLVNPFGHRLSDVTTVLNDRFATVLPRHLLANVGLVGVNLRSGALNVEDDCAFGLDLVDADFLDHLLGDWGGHDTAVLHELFPTNLQLKIKS